MKNHQKSALLFVSLLGVFFIQSCNMPVEPPPPTNTPEATVVVVTPTIEPTAEPIVETDELVLLSGTGTNPGVFSFLQNNLSQLSNNTYHYQEVSTFSDIPDDVDFVFLSEPSADLASYADEHPDIHFIVFDNSLPASSNIWPVNYDPGYLPFLSGLALAISSYDWRSAALLPSDSVLYGTRYSETLVNGAQFFCGRCKSNLAPYNSYPLVGQLPATSAASDWGSLIDELQKSFVYTYYVPADIASEELYQKLLTLDVKIIGESEPPAGLESHWLARIHFDWVNTFVSLMEEAKSGVSAHEIIPELSVEPGQIGEQFNTGKAQRLQLVYEDMINGLVSPYDPVPQTSYQQ